MPGTDHKNIVELNDVQFAWSRQTAPVIDLARLEIGRGERVFLQGPSGSGKTTLLSLIAAVISPQSGSIRIDGVELAELKGAQRDRFRADHLGLVFQQFNLLPFLSVAENVQLPCRFSSYRRSRACEDGRSLQSETERLLSAMNLPVSAYEKRSVMELSVGQQQRVAVARALLGRPSLVIADEPTSSLDADAQQAFMQLLFDEIRQAQASLLFVSHDMSLASGFDRQYDLRQLNRSADV